MFNRKRTAGRNEHHHAAATDLPVWEAEWERAPLRVAAKQTSSEYWVLDTGYWVLDTGYWILGTGYWVPGTALTP